MNRKPITWIFVTDHQQAKILVNYGPKTGLKTVLVDDMSHHIATETVQKATKSTGWLGFGAKTPVIKKAPPKKEPTNMVDDVANLINKAAKQDRFDTLVLVGPKNIMTNIRDQFCDDAEKRMHGELSKDLTNATAGQLESYLGNIINL